MTSECEVQRSKPYSQDHFLLQLSMQYVILVDLYWGERWHCWTRTSSPRTPTGFALAATGFSPHFLGLRWRSTSHVKYIHQVEQAPSAIWKSFRAPEQQSECTCYRKSIRIKAIWWFLYYFNYNTLLCGSTSQSVSNNTPHILLLTMFETYRLHSHSSQAMATPSIRGMIIVKHTRISDLLNMSSIVVTPFQCNWFCMACKRSFWKSEFCFFLMWHFHLAVCSILSLRAPHCCTKLKLRLSTEAFPLSQT